MRLARAVQAVGLVGLLAGPAFGQDDAPADGAVPGTFRAFVAADDRYPAKNPRNRADRMHCPVIENGLNPVCAVFTRTDPARAADGPLGTLVKQLNAVVQKNKANNAAAFVAFLTLSKPYQDDDARAEKAAAARALADQLKAPGVPFLLASGVQEEADPSASLAAWQVGAEADTVVVVYNRMKVVKRWTFTADKPPTAEDIQAITAAFEAEAKGG